MGISLLLLVGSAVALTPRQQLVSAPYALMADTVPNGSLTADKFASNAFNATT